MNLKALDLFIQVSRVGNFARAAQQLGLDPSQVSRKIATLERELGFRLFQRTTRAISLTEAGSDFLSRIEPHVAAIEEARAAGRDLNEQPQGLLRVTASTSFGYEILTPLLPKLTEQLTKLKIEFLLTDRRINLVEEGVDLAIRLGALPESDLVATKIMPIRFRIYAKKALDKPTMPSNEVECLTYSNRQSDRIVMVRDKFGATSTLTLKAPIAMSNALALKRCACLGLAPAFLPDWLVQPELADGSLIDVFPDLEFSDGDVDSAIWCVYPSRRYVPLKVRKFIEFVKHELVNADELEDF